MQDFFHQQYESQVGASLISTYQAFISWSPGTLYDAWHGPEMVAVGVLSASQVRMACLSNLFSSTEKGRCWNEVAEFTFQTGDKC